MKLHLNYNELRILFSLLQKAIEESPYGDLESYCNLGRKIKNYKEKAEIKFKEKMIYQNKH